MKETHVAMPNPGGSRFAGRISAVFSPFLSSRNVRRPGRAWLGLAIVSALLAGCAASPSSHLPPAHAPETQTLHAGDVVQITFPAATSMNTTQQIRRDGKLNLYLVGEVQAADLTPGQLQSALKQKYSTQLVSAEVNVTVVSSVFAVYVTGAVLHPGRITPDREVTAFEAVMEAGGFDPAKANPKAVAIIRRDGDQTKNFRLNLQAILDGKETEQFYLKPNDVVYVPERLSLF